MFDDIMKLAKKLEIYNRHKEAHAAIFGRLDINAVKAGTQIRYVGDSFAFGGDYTVYPIEETYKNKNDVPEYEKGKLVIIEFMNNGTPMFFRVDQLDLTEWRIIV